MKKIFLFDFSLIEIIFIRSILKRKHKYLTVGTNNVYIKYLPIFVHSAMRQCNSSYRMSGLDRRTNVDVQILSAASKAIAEKCFWNACKALSFGLFLMAVGAIMAIIGKCTFMITTFTMHTIRRYITTLTKYYNTTLYLILIYTSQACKITVENVCRND